MTTILIIKIILAIAYPLLEHYLGKTQYGSTIGFILNLFSKEKL